MKKKSQHFLPSDIPPCTFSRYQTTFEYSSYLINNSKQFSCRQLFWTIVKKTQTFESRIISKEKILKIQYSFVSLSIFFFNRVENPKQKFTFFFFTNQRKKSFKTIGRKFHLNNCLVITWRPCVANVVTFTTTTTAMEQEKIIKKC